MDVGGDLVVASKQDIGKSKNSNWSVGGTATVGAGASVDIDADSQTGDSVSVGMGKGSSSKAAGDMLKWEDYVPTNWAPKKNTTYKKTSKD